MLALLPDYVQIGGWGKSFKNGASCHDQKRGGMQPKRQTDVAFPSMCVIDASLLLDRRRFHKP
jgi:hypothetical protein